MKLIRVIKQDAHYTKKCPYRKWYEAINRYFIACVGDEVCKYCGHNKGIKIINEIPYIKCEHPEELEIIPTNRK